MIWLKSVMETLGRPVYCVSFTFCPVVELQRVKTYALANCRRSIDLRLDLRFNVV
jgi:hypothetical protein